MGHVSRSEFRQRLAHYLNEAIEGRSVVVVTRQGDRNNVVIMSEDEFAGWQETVHLLRNPANAKRLLRSVRSAHRGRTQERALVAVKPRADA